MKLIDLLVKELPKRGGWPSNALSVAQDSEGCCWGYECENLTLQSHGWWKSKSGHAICTGGIMIEEMASDWDSSFVTRAQYEAALAKNYDWIEWGGGECPVDEGEIVDLKDRDGYLWIGAEALFSTEARAEFWRHTGGQERSSDIIAYRLHRDINSRANDDRLEQGLNECIGQNVDMPEWDGEGLPPVGTICEALMPALDNTLWRWRIVKVVESGAPGAEKEVLAYDIENTKPAWTDEFRPLRTEAEKAREETIGAIRKLLDAGVSNVQDAIDIYEAISAGTIPGIKLENK